MTGNVIIEAENISKLYRLGKIGTGSLSHDLNRYWHKMRGKEDPYLKIAETNDRESKDSSGYVWALKEVSFQVRQGEVLGIVGRNGAGKSTLLKILSRVTVPDTGRIGVKGRIVSLLEVGTGFHPELTGRENIFLNGAILGMRRAEIVRKFDEIVAFSGVDKYIDTPVKRYSSGMYVRLAFSVAAHLEPEILIIDEVLAVGDAEFQKKCIGKMKEVSVKEGRTVLFVSHNLAAVKQLCDTGLLMSRGQVLLQSDVSTVVAKYQESGSTAEMLKHDGEIGAAPGNAAIRLLEVTARPIKGNYLSISSGVRFSVAFWNSEPGINLDLTLELRTLDEQTVFHTGLILSADNDSKTGRYAVEGELPPDLLNAGVYTLKLIFGKNQRHALFAMEEAIRFEILNEAFGYNASTLPGVIRPNLHLKHSFQ